MASPPVTRNAILQTLEYFGPMTSAELTESIGKSRKAVEAAIHGSYHRTPKLLYIKEFRRTVGTGGREAAVYAIGDLPDAPRPKLGTREAIRKRKQEWAEKNRARINLRAQSRRKGVANVNHYLQLTVYEKKIKVPSNGSTPKPRGVRHRGDVPADGA